MDFNELKELGLDESEIKVYIGCLSEGGLSVKDIAKKSGIIRTTAYGLLQGLQRKGLVSVIDKDGVLFFRAAPPQELLNILDQKRDRIASILPELQKLQALIPQSAKVEFFEGRNGVKVANNDIISKPNETVKIIANMQKWMQFSEGYTATYYRKKKEMNVTTKTLLADTAIERSYGANSKVKNTEFRFIKKLNITNSSLFIYHDKVSFVIYEDNDVTGCCNLFHDYF